MSQSKHYHSPPPSQKLLYIAIVSTFFTIITFILIGVTESNTLYYIFPTVFTIISLILGFISFGWKDNIPPYFKHFSINRIFHLSTFNHLIQTVGFISTVLTMLTTLGAASIILGSINKGLLLIFVGVMVSILSLLLFIIFYTLLEEKAKMVASSTDTIPYPPPSDDEEFEVLLKKIVFEYAPGGQTMWQRKRLHIRLLKNGINCYTDRFRWTGSGEYSVKILTSGFDISNQHKEGLWDYFTINFPYTLHKGEELDFTIEWKLIDKERTAITFLSSMIERKTDHLLLQVILPHELAPKRAYSYEFENFIDTLPIETNQISWSPATKSLNYDVAYPKKYHKYTIRWYND